MWQNGLMPSPAKRMSGGSTPSAGVWNRGICHGTVQHVIENRRAARDTSPDRVALLVCGPTVYDYSHMGHARTYVVLMYW